MGINYRDGKWYKTPEPWEDFELPNPLPYEGSYFERQANDIAEQINQKTEEEIDAVKSIAESASKYAIHSESIAKSAYKIANKADIKGWIALLLSAVALLFEFAVHRVEIISFFSLFVK